MDPAAGVFHYGQALFEGLKAFRGTDGSVSLFRLDEHCARMAWRARLCMPPVELALMRELVLEYMKVEADWVPRSSGTSLYLRPTMIATEGFLGVRVAALPLLHHRLAGGRLLRGRREAGAHLGRARAHSRGEGRLGAVKAGANYAASLLAARAPRRRATTRCSGSTPRSTTRWKRLAP